MQQQNQPQSEKNMPFTSNTTIGGHELLDVHEAIDDLVGGMEQYVLYEQQVQDEELKQMIDRHKSFMQQIYNTIIETLKTGQDPSVPTQTYHMEQNNHVTYGIQPSAPKAPAQTAQEINDECICNFMLGSLKQISASFTTTAMEATNPVLRRIVADSIPNIIEMGYELFLYQNKKQYYQVPLLKEEDMQILKNSFAPIQNPMTH